MRKKLSTREGKNNIIPPDMSQKLKTKAVTKDEFMALQVRNPRRMQLASSRFLTREEGKPWYGKCSAQFSETVGLLFKAGTGLSLRLNEFGVFYPIKSEEKFKLIQKWVKEQETRVFLRTLLPCCVALDLLRTSPAASARTKIGELEYHAKRRNEKAEAKLGETLARSINSMPIYSDARFIAAVPPLRDKSSGLASRLSGRVASALEIIDLTDNFSRLGEAPAIKNMAETDKWDGLEKAELTLASGPKNLPKKGESVILLDDKYQSGTTMHYVAMQMQAAGVDGPILGLVAVKTLSDSDNKR